MIDRIDHFVMTVKSIERTCSFYRSVLGMEHHTPEGKPASISFGRHKINLHQVDRTFDPKARVPMPGSSDFCLVTSLPIAEFAVHLEHCGVEVEKGPVERSGATGQMVSVYFRDPDGNLVEVSQYLPTESQ